MEDDKGSRRSSARVLVIATGLLFAASTAGATMVTNGPVEETRLTSGAVPDDAPDQAPAAPQAEVPPGVPVSTTAPAPSTVPLPVTTVVPKLAVTVPRVPVPNLPTTTGPATTTTSVAPMLDDTGRPPCLGEPSGYNGYGCQVTKTEGRMTTVWAAYGQVLQNHRDPVAIELKVSDTQGGLPRSWRIDYGDGTVVDRSGENFRCGQPIPPYTDQHSHVYTSPGTYDVTVTVLNSRCEWVDPNNHPFAVRWFDEQTMTLTVPVRVCTEIYASNTAVYCKVP